jgi:Bacterial surface proteins containing Ig-like domains
MKNSKRIVAVILLFVFIFTIADIPAISNPVTAQAATLKISKKTLVVEVGKTATLKVSGTKSAVKWTTSDASIATVTSKGKVSGISKGTAKITAAVAGKKLICDVTVTLNPYLADAPFKAQEVQILNVDFVMPVDWNGQLGKPSGTGIVAQLAPTDTSLKSKIAINVTMLGDKVPEYAEAKKQFTSVLTEDFFKKTWASLGTDLTTSNFTQEDFTVPYGTALRTGVAIKAGDTAINEVVYDFIIGSYYIEVAALDYDNLNLADITDYMIKSIMVTQ